MRWSKRAFDLLFTIPGLLLLTPLFALVALAIKADDGGPVFFRQERVGYRGHRFLIWKFRTMVVEAGRLGGEITVGRDPRITRIGHWLRLLKLDELPQLFNVLAGEMSLVGPRPEVQRYVSRYTASQRQVLEIFPGITDPASILYRKESEVLARSPSPEETYIEEIMPEKILINMNYSMKSNCFRDFMTIIKTLLPGGSLD